MDVGQEMGDPVLIAAVRDHPSQPISDAEPTIGLSEQHDPAIRTDPPAVKGGGDLPALHGWKGKQQKIIVGHGGRGALRSGKGLASATESYAGSNAYLLPPPHFRLRRG